METQAYSTYELAATNENNTRTEANVRGAKGRKLRRSAALTLIFAFCAVGLSFPAAAQEASLFTAFRASGAGTSAYQGTYPTGGSNAAGETIGFYFSAGWGR